MSSFNDRGTNQEIASPMTNLANSLGTTLSVRRRLTLSESSETPKKCYDNVLHGKLKFSTIMFVEHYLCINIPIPNMEH